MRVEELLSRLRVLAQEKPPLPGGGTTPQRLRRLFEAGEEDLTLAKLIEAHWDAVAILAEAGRESEEGAIYGVWASEIPGQSLLLTEKDAGFVLNGSKPFCSGIGIVDRALLTVRGPQALIIDVDVRERTEGITADVNQWATDAFRATRTGAITFADVAVDRDAVVGNENFYLDRPGFWHGACGPAACWVGGAAGLVAFARRSKRADAHTLAHLGAMDASLWMMEMALARAGEEIDAAEGNATVRALRLRHVVEQGCTEILRRLTRAYGPYPLAIDAETARRYHELDLYLRQTHAERDLESLGRALLEVMSPAKA